MQLFEAILLLLVVAVVLLQISRRLNLPYPAMLAVAGGLVAAIPWAPQLSIEPHLALALFITPALLDSAFDTSPRELLRNWAPLTALVVFAVLFTTAAVAFVGWSVAGLPLAAAVALGAIVAPPDAAAAAAVLQGYRLPRRTVTVLQGESLLNDAVALLIFAAAVAAVGASVGASTGPAADPGLAAMSGAAAVGASSAASAASATTGAVPGVHSGRSVTLMLLLAVPGGVLLGVLLGKIYLKLVPFVAGTLSSTIVEFVVTFGVWIIADRLGVSAILAVVAYAMVIATYLPSRTRARDRVHSYAVWNAAVFVLNVLAFLLMGLQARVILARLEGDALWHALGIASLVLLVVVLARLAWVLVYFSLLGAYRARTEKHGKKGTLPTMKIGLLVSWCGMRGLVTLATAFALPDDFPGRDVIVLSAFMVVIGTLVVQGLTIGPLMKLLKIAPDDSLESEIAQARATMLHAALDSIDDESGAAADAVKSGYTAALQMNERGEHPDKLTGHDALRMKAIRAERLALNRLRSEARIDDDVYHRLEEELDWAELSAAPSDQSKLLVT